MQPLDQSLAQLDRLAAFDGGPFPVLSVYLDLRADSQGRDHVEPFLRKELSGRIRTFRSASPEWHSLEEDAGRIRAYAADGIRCATVWPNTSWMSSPWTSGRRNA